jgi:hypothetical protein
MALQLSRRRELAVGNSHRTVPLRHRGVTTVQHKDPVSMASNRSLAATAALIALSGCQMAPMAPDPTRRANADMLRVLTAYQASGAKPIAMLTVAQARA